MAPSVRRSPLWGWIGRALTIPVAIGIAFAAAAPRNAFAETIEAALAKAYSNNPQLNAQRAIVRQTDEDVPQALSGYRPTITANATVGRQYTDTKNIIPPTPGLVPNGAAFADRGLTTPYSVGATASQTFFNGERTANSVRQAESKVSAARETLRVMEQSVLLGRGEHLHGRLPRQR